MVDIETLFQIAETLRKDDFFHEFKVEAIVGLLLTKGLCAYCDDDLFATWAAVAGGVHTDHLLPESKYKHHEHLLSDPLNLVPSCWLCNSPALKGDWDPNTEIAPQVYRPESKQPLSEEQHNVLVKRAREYVAQKRAEKEREFRRTFEHWRAALLDAELGPNPR